MRLTSTPSTVSTSKSVLKDSIAAYLARLRILETDLGLLLTLLVVGLVQGLIFLFLMPPWQHYDEANHFEYAWLIANRNTRPQVGEYDQEMRRAVATSMIENGFFKGQEVIPDLNAEGPIWIGNYSQITDPPLYYFLISLPLRLYRSAPYENIEGQLYSVRMVSLILFLFTILMAWLTARELSPPRSTIRWLLPLVIPLIPGFADLMTSVNTDVPAVAIFSLFVWSSTALIRRGLSIFHLVFFGLSLVLCFFGKNTVWIAIPLGAIALILAVSPARWRWFVWAGLAAGILVSIPAVFTWRDAALWGRETFQTSPTRVQLDNAPLGKFVFQLEYEPQVTPAKSLRLNQLILNKQAKELQGKPLTVGAWIWASRPIAARTAALQVHNYTRVRFETIQIDQDPTFYSITIPPQDSTARTLFQLFPIVEAETEPVTIYYDGIVLAEGSYPLDETPDFEDESGASGTWGGRAFQNLVRNASAEQAGLGVRSWFDRLGMRVLPDKGRFSVIAYTLTDLSASFTYYRSAAVIMIRTFWAYFGWAHVPLLGRKPYWPIFIVTGLGLLGLPLFFWLQQRRKTPRENGFSWHTVLFLGLVAFVIWAQTIVRGAIYFFLLYYYPPARYAYPAIIPTVLILLAGWRAWVPRRSWPYARLAILAGLVLLNVYSVYSIYTYYYG